jgi:hypothetical protein
VSYGINADYLLGAKCLNVPEDYNKYTDDRATAAHCNYGWDLEYGKRVQLIRVGLQLAVPDRLSASVPTAEQD